MRRGEGRWRRRGRGGEERNVPSSDPGAEGAFTILYRIACITFRCMSDGTHCVWIGSMNTVLHISGPKQAAATSDRVHRRSFHSRSYSLL